MIDGGSEIDLKLKRLRVAFKALLQLSSIRSSQSTCRLVLKQYFF